MLIHLEQFKFKKLDLETYRKSLKKSFIINGIAQENEVRKPLVDFLGCVRLCKPGKNGMFRPPGSDAQ